MTNNKPLAATDLPVPCSPVGCTGSGRPLAIWSAKWGQWWSNRMTQASAANRSGSHARARGPVVTDIVLIDRDSNALPDDRLALWSAASGVSLRDGSWPVTASVPLVAPSRPRPAGHHGTDRTLRWALAAALVCAGLRAWRYASQPTPGAAASRCLTAPAPGALLDRISIFAPDLLPHSAERHLCRAAPGYLVLAEAYDAAAMQRATRMLEGNGLVVQSARAGSARLRVSLPVESKPQ